MSPERLQKVLASAGVASRRDSEEMIAAGRVAVNGKVVRVQGARVDLETDEVTVDGKPIVLPTTRTYIMLHKPRGVVSTAEDTHARPTVVEMVQSEARLYPVGRLDMDSEGLILLTDDGALTQQLTHPSFEIEKEYRALLNGVPSPEMLRSWRSGVELNGEMTAPAWVDVIEQTDDGVWVRVVLHEGRKRQIRDVARLLGYDVMQLIRVREGSLTLGELPAGEWRSLTDEEVAALQEHGRKAEAAVRPRRERPRLLTRPERIDEQIDARAERREFDNRERRGFGERSFSDRPARREFDNRERREERGPRRDDRGFGGREERGPRRDDGFGSGFGNRERGGFGGGREDRGPRREGGFGDRGPRREGGFGDRGPRLEGGFGDRGPRREGGFGGGREERGGFGDRGPRREGGFSGGREERGPRREGGFGGGREDRGGFGDRGPRREGGFGGGREDRGPRREGGFGGGREDRGPRREGGFGGGREERGGFGDRGPRREGGFGGGREDRGGFGDRGPRREGGFGGGREERGGFGDRGPRREGGFGGGREERGGFGDRGPRREGGFGGGREDRGPRREGGFGGREDRGSFGDRGLRREGGFGGGRDDRGPRREGGFGGGRERGNFGGRSGGNREERAPRRDPRTSGDGFRPLPNTDNDDE